MNKNLLSSINYLKHIEKQNLSINVKNKMKLLMNEENDKLRVIMWKEIIEPLNEKELALLVNPYFIGYGNPNSDFLFIGQEKAFDISTSQDLLLQESVNNNFQWKKIKEGTLTPLIFNPKFPRKYHNHKLKRGHTWDFYSRVISPFYNLNQRELINETQIFSKSFFNYCFVSEINDVPRKRNKKDIIKNERKKFLKNSFYKTFKYVVIGASTSLGENPDEVIKEIFDADLVKGDRLVGYYGKKKPMKRTVSLYRSDKQSIILCNQLSGSAGWTDKHLDKLHLMFK